MNSEIKYTTTANTTRDIKYAHEKVKTSGKIGLIYVFRTKSSTAIIIDEKVGANKISINCFFLMFSDLEIKLKLIGKITMLTMLNRSATPTIPYALAIGTTNITNADNLIKLRYAGIFGFPSERYMLPYDTEKAPTKLRIHKILKGKIAGAHFSPKAINTNSGANTKIQTLKELFTILHN